MDPAYEKLPAKSGFKAPFASVFRRTSSQNAQASPDLPSESAPVSTPRQHSKTRIFFHWISHILSLLWLGPIAALLYLNFSSHVVGASVWCPNGNCNADATSDNAIARAQKLDRQDHDVNGALQFVAKGLEVWFMFVATSLLYDVGMMFAKKGRGLPVGYLLTHLEFGDIRYIFNPLLWTSPIPHRNAVPEKRIRIIKLYLFAFTTAFLTILSNLMGPATAVLVLPTLQWVETPHRTEKIFNGTGVTFGPSGDYLFPDCNDTQLLAGNYSCNFDTYGPSLDQWAASGISSLRQAVTYEGGLILASSQEASLQFTLNTTGDTLWWVPNRQVLRELSYDYRKANGDMAEDDPPQYPDKVYNNSLQTLLQRQGPSIGVQSSCYVGEVTQIELDDDRFVRCFTNWTWDFTANYTKCLRLGSGFSNESYYEQFWLGDVDPNVPDLQTRVGVFSADRAMFFNDTDDFGSGIQSCLSNQTNAPCDWDKVFSTPLPEEILSNSSINVGVVEYSVPGINNPDGRLWCDHIAYLGFPTYSVDTSPNSNLQQLVVLDDLPSKENGTVPLVVPPDWFLAAWSVDLNGTLDGERQVVKELTRMLPLAYNESDGNVMDSLEGLEFYLLHTYALGQSFSFINYYNFSGPADPSSKKIEDATEDTDHPALKTWAKIHVWAYGLSDRTPKLGVTVVILGCCCVIMRFILGVITGIHERSTVEVLAAAFEHRHGGEFEGMEEESHMAKVRYQVIDDGVGKQRFVPEKQTSRWSNAISHFH